MVKFALRGDIFENDEGTCNNDRLIGAQGVMFDHWHVYAERWNYELTCMALSTLRILVEKKAQS